MSPKTTLPPGKELPLPQNDIGSYALPEGDTQTGEAANGKIGRQETGDRQHDADERDVSTPEEDQKSLGNRLKKWWLIPLAGVVVAVGGLSYIRIRDKNAPPPPVEAAAAVSVQTATAETAPIRAWTSSEGLIQAVRFKHLAFDVAGDVTYIASKNGRTLRAGDTVAAGELLAQIDDRTLQADINQARAALAEARQRQATAGADVASAQAQVTQARSQVNQALAQLNQAESARSLAQTDFQRYQTLYEQGALSATERDSRRNNAQDTASQVVAAQSQVTAARSQVDTAQAQVTAARGQQQALSSQVETAQARLEQAQIALEDTQLYAPFDGVVAYMNLRENEYYTPQSVSSQLGQDYGEILDRIPVVVVDPSQYEVVADFAAYRGEQVEPGQTALVTADRLGNRGDNSGEILLSSADARGQVSAVNPAVNPGERSIEVTALLTSNRESLKHGQNVTTWIAIASDPSATVVPLNAVTYRDQQPYVFVVNPENNKVEQRPVDVGIEGLSERQIVSGVTAGEQVVVSGQNRLVDGATVQIAQSGFTDRNETNRETISEADS
ncbi:MAG: biotin/lipoyl-binding protein [Cyanobacteria bacterium P01_D01_bin.105]